MPHTDAVVVVRSNPINPDQSESTRSSEFDGSSDPVGAASKRQKQLLDHLKVGRAGSPAADVSTDVEISEDDRLAHLRALYTATVAAKAA